VAINGLYVWVEGSDDIRFFERVMMGVLEQRYDWVKIVTYAEESTKWINNFLISIKAMGADYIFAADYDSSPSIAHRIQALQNSYKHCDAERIQLIIEEIEGWYIAGLEDESCKQLKVPCLKNTNSLTKEQFNNLVPKKFTSRIDFMVEVLKAYSISTAMNKNDSFKFFVEKYA